MTPTPPCTIKLDVFEGPLDLLLHLIKRNEVQIADIPIATITDQYLALLEDLPELNLDGAGEYLVMAATLTYIKSRMLLPTVADGEDETEDDPRAALVQQLLEYQRYREAAATLSSRPLLERDVFAPSGEPAPAGTSEDGRPLVRDASLGDLLDALRGILDRTRKPEPHSIFRPGLSVSECVHRILARFALGSQLRFDELFSAESDRTEVVVTFLALLELIRLKVVRAIQSDRFGPIELGLAAADLGEAATMVQDVGFDSWRGGGEPHGSGPVE
ncbi:MAG TPA: segregation/condensation protein A [Candidatus Binatia bacterium]|jgi:segregation and condensation protein A|nr:segregation/condensation protein A [Candidatus Binatia bacterium]